MTTYLGRATLALAFCALAACTLAGCSTRTHDGPVTAVLAHVDAGDVSEFDVLDVANGLCVRLDQGWKRDDATAEWVDAGWDAALVGAVADALDTTPAYCEGVLPHLHLTETMSAVG